MPNLVITNACNLSCPFCFATEYRATAVPCDTSAMTVDEFRRQVEFVGTDTVRFCGGEPTLHPDFPTLLDIALKISDRRVFMMTNALWPESVRRHVGSLGRKQVERITYLINLLEPSLMTDEQRICLDTTLATLNPDTVTLGLTIYKSPFEFEYLFEAARRFDISHIRYSVAAPTLTDPTSWRVDPERDFRDMAGIVFRLVTEARAQSLSVQSDCGYIPPCMFTEAQLAELTRDTGNGPPQRFHCDGPIDIGPGGEAWRCYGLYSSVRAQTDEFEHGGRLVEHFERQTGLLDDRDLFDWCPACDFRERGECGGGCHAYRSLREMRSRAQISQVSIDDDEEFLSAVPSIDADCLRFMQRNGDSVPMLFERDGTWTEFRLTTSEHQVLRACDGRKSVGELVADLGSETGTVQRAIRKLFEQGAIALRPPSA